MSIPAPVPPGWWRTVWILLGSARVRAVGRRRRQQELADSRLGRSALGTGTLGWVMSFLLPWR